MTLTHSFWTLSRQRQCLDDRGRIFAPKIPKTGSVAALPEILPLDLSDVAQYLVLLNRMTIGSVENHCWRKGFLDCFTQHSRSQQDAKLHVLPIDKAFLPHYRRKLYLNETFGEVVSKVKASGHGYNEGVYSSVPFSTFWPSYTGTFTRLLSHSMYSRYIFWSKKGLLGITGREVQYGDLVVGFDGALAPFLMCEERDQRGADGCITNTVGECYVHGWDPRAAGIEAGYSGKLKDLFGNEPLQSTTFVIAYCFEDTLRRATLCGFVIEDTRKDRWRALNVERKTGVKCLLSVLNDTGYLCSIFKLLDFIFCRADLWHVLLWRNCDHLARIVLEDSRSCRTLGTLRMLHRSRDRTSACSS